MPATFIKAVELWVPGEDGSLLEFSAGAFGAARAFASLSRSMCFGRGEGLPGHAWDEGRPLLLRSLDSGYFQRTAAAQAAGLGCAIAMPLYRQDALRAVLVLFCGHDTEHAAALELWHQDARVSSDMTLVDGAYGPTHPGFEAVSRETYLPRGVGLPGRAWQRGEAVFVEDLGAEPTRFLRAEQATETGMLRGLALPLGSQREDCHVVTFLAGPALPLAHRIERWALDATGANLQRLYAFSELHGGHTALSAELPLPSAATAAGSAAHSAIVQAWISGLPVINPHPRDERGAPAAAAAACGAMALVAIPVLREGEVNEVLALYL
ncbi:MAG: GAF domain-containing protein [Burkholderiales bacterium]